MPPPAYTRTAQAAGLAAHDAAFSAKIITVSALDVASGAAFCSIWADGVVEVPSPGSTVTGTTVVVSCATAYEQQHAIAAAASRVMR
ncbi:hypothetical protein DIE04_28550 [Burkholderia sp. Bp8994]|nr:hypothetical protein DIE04_28550 [Burkholderia sp. Bp8994]RQS59432.1 hypothetical protein DID99_02590 [Burkholderia sp. Bp8986]